MNKSKTVLEWMNDQDVELDQLVQSSGIDKKVVEAIVAGRYTTSPKHRQQIAHALGVAPEGIRWGQAVTVDHMYGHGPQFGRSP